MDQSGQTNKGSVLRAIRGRTSGVGVRSEKVESVSRRTTSESVSSRMDMVYSL